MKRLLLIKKKNRHYKLLNSALFSIWEEARVWADWNHSLDGHLCSLGPVPCSSPSWVPSGCTVRVAAVAEGMVVSSPFIAILASLRAHPQGCYNMMAWWPWHPLFTDVAGDIFHSQFPESMFSRTVWHDPLSHCILWSKELDKSRSKTKGCAAGHDPPLSGCWRPTWEVPCSWTTFVPPSGKTPPAQLGRKSEARTLVHFRLGLHPPKAFFFFGLFRATPTADGSYQDMGGILAAAAI